MAANYVTVIIIAYRLFHDPEPPIRCILDAISAFHLAIKCSLRVGLLQKRSFSLEFPRHVFNFLFQSKGSAVVKKPGRLYQRNDIVELYFNDEHFQYFNKYGEGCFVLFPMYMRSFVKFSPLTYKNDGTLHSLNCFL